VAFAGYTCGDADNSLPGECRVGFNLFIVLTQD
jgi:hypothetical protein